MADSVSSAYSAIACSIRTACDTLSVVLRGRTPAVHGASSDARKRNGFRGTQPGAVRLDEAVDVGLSICHGWIVDGRAR